MKSLSPVTSVCALLALAPSTWSCRSGPDDGMALLLLWSAMPPHATYCSTPLRVAEDNTIVPGNLSKECLSALSNGKYVRIACKEPPEDVNWNCPYDVFSTTVSRVVDGRLQVQCGKSTPIVVGVETRERNRATIHYRWDVRVEPEVSEALRDCNPVPVAEEPPGVVEVERVEGAWRGR